MVGTLSLCPPYWLQADLLSRASATSAALCDKLARPANQFGFSEIASTPGIKNIPLPSQGKSAA
jgi:hypothetical protein